MKDSFGVYIQTPKEFFYKYNGTFFRFYAFSDESILRMLQSLKKIFSLMLLMAVLLANTGIVVVKHQCKMRGESVFLFGKPTDTCCSSIPTSQGCSIEAPACCLEQTNIHKITTDFQFSAYSLVLAAPQSFFISLFEDKAIFLAYIPLSLIYPNFPNPPPLPTGKALLTYLATFLI